MKQWWLWDIITIITFQDQDFHLWSELGLTMINTSRSWNIFRCVIESEVTLECLLDIFFLDSWFFIWSFSLKQYINIKITIKGYQNYKARERRPWSRLAIIICPVFYPRQITSYCPHQKTSFIDNFDKTSWGLLISEDWALTIRAGSRLQIHRTSHNAFLWSHLIFWPRIPRPQW